jgi:hypothetical protein
MPPEPLIGSLRRDKRNVVCYWREWTLCLVSLALLAAIMTVAGPISQDVTYHQFADRRAVLGVPNFFNVASNITFLLVGVAGAAFCLGRQVSGAVVAWTVLFLGAAMVSIGSGYYHWAPDNAALVWDRLPMTVGFMGLFVALLSEHVSKKLERVMLIPALAVGAASVAWWRYADDLRLYVWVQFMPLVILPLVVALFPGQYNYRRFLLYGLGCYLLAKLAEYFDHGIFALTGGTLSGHSLKHLLAALGLLFVYLMLWRREPIPAPQPSPSGDGAALA